MAFLAKLAARASVTGEEEILLKECSAEMEQAYEIAAKYATVVLALAEGSLPLEKFMELLKTV